MFDGMFNFNFARTCDFTILSIDGVVSVLQYKFAVVVVVIGKYLYIF